jgi:tRNA(fMet)-specific endonuclease VapC
MNYCLDTNICIYFLKGTFPALLPKVLSVNPNNIIVPAIVKAELLCGAEKSQRTKDNILKITAFLMPFEIKAFDDSAAVQYSKIRASLEKAGTPIGPNDLIIAAIALAGDYTLVTNNMKEFERIPGLRLENWID